MSLKRKTARGVLWTAASKMSMQLVLFINMLILAHLLSKDDFGIVGVAAIVTVAISMVNDKGLGTSIIQKKDIDSGELSSLFWGSVLFGLILTFFTILVSFPAALYFKEPIVQSVFTVQAVGFLVGSFGIVQKSLLTKEMRFKQLAIIEMIAVLINGVVSIILALLGFGVWSIVIGILVRDFLTVLFLWIFCEWRPSLHFNWSEFKRYLGFSSAVLSNDVAIYATTNADVTIIGRVLGTEMLGVYTFALYLVKLPVTRLSSVVSKVVFPALSSVQNDIRKFKKGYLDSMTLISFFTFFLLAALTIFAKEVVEVVLPEKWSRIVFPLQALAPMAMLKSVGTIRGSVFMAIGRPDIELKWNVFYLVPLIIAILLGTKFGLNGVAVAFSGIYIITFPIIQLITNRLVNTSTTEYLLAFKSTGLATLAVFVAGYLFRQFVYQFSIFGDLAVLICGLLLIGAVYLLVIYLVEKQLIIEVLSIFKSATNKQKKLATVV